tara:strand:- start:1770 stop:2213 length:444 start_codon:yes stop_codon:yes gene_type:complete
MKNIIFFVLLISSSFAFAQVNYDKYIVSKYYETKTWDYKKNTFETTESGWSEVSMYPHNEYYLIIVEGETSKIWWEYSSEATNDEGNAFGDIYFTEDGRKVVFNYDAQEIWFYNEVKDGKYSSVTALSKIETFDKEKEYVPQSKRRD